MLAADKAPAVSAENMDFPGLGVEDPDRSSPRSKILRDLLRQLLREIVGRDDFDGESRSAVMRLSKSIARIRSAGTKETSGIRTVSGVSW